MSEKSGLAEKLGIPAWSLGLLGGLGLAGALPVVLGASRQERRERLAKSAQKHMDEHQTHTAHVEETLANGLTAAILCCQQIAGAAVMSEQPELVKEAQRVATDIALAYGGLVELGEKLHAKPQESEGKAEGEESAGTETGEGE